VSIFDNIRVEQQLEENQHASTTADLGLLSEKSGSGVDLLLSADRGDLHQQTAHRQPSLPTKRQAEDILHETNVLEQRLTRSRCTSTHADAAPTLAALPVPPTSIELTRGRGIDVGEISESLLVLKEAPSGGNRQQGEVGTGGRRSCALHDEDTAQKADSATQVSETAAEEQGNKQGSDAEKRTGSNSIAAVAAQVESRKQIKSTTHDARDGEKSSITNEREQIFGGEDGSGRFGASEIDASGEQEGTDEKRTPLSIIKGNQQGAVPQRVNRRFAVPGWAGGAGVQGKNGEEKETYSGRGKYKVAPSIENEKRVDMFEKRVDMFKQGYLALVGGGGQHISYERTAWCLQKCGGVSGVCEWGCSVLRVCGCADLCGECTARCVLGCWRWHCVYRHNAATTWSASV